MCVYVKSIMHNPQVHFTGFLSQLACVHAHMNECVRACLCPRMNGLTGLIVEEGVL